MSVITIGNCEKCGIHILKAAHNRLYCDECRKEVSRETARQRQAKYREEHREEISARRIQKYSADPEKERERQRQWRQQNTDKCQEYVERNRERRKANPQASRECSKRWALANKERVLENARRWRHDNPDKTREHNRTDRLKNSARCAEYRVKNREKIREKQRIWVEANRQKVRIYNRHRQALKRGAEGSHTAEEFFELCKRLNWKCFYCGCKINSKTVTEDHIKPISRGGTDYIENIVPACQSCNSSKHTKTVNEFILQTGSLKGELLLWG